MLEIKKEIELDELEIAMTSLAQELAGKIFEVTLEALDEEIREEVPETWQNVGREARGTVFEHGHTIYYRRVYKDERGRRHKPLDALLGIKPYERNSQKVQEMGSVLAAQTTYRLAAEGLSYSYRILYEYGEDIFQPQQHPADCVENGDAYR